MEVGAIKSARKKHSRYSGGSYLAYDYKCMYLLAVFFLLGAVFGAMVGSFSAVGKIADIERYFFPGLTGVSFSVVLWNTSWYHLLAVFLGTSIVGAALLPLLSSLRGYLISLTAASIITGMPENGVLLSLAYLGIPLIFSLPAFFLISSDAFQFSKRLYLMASNTNKQITNTPFLQHLLFCFAALILSALAEAYVLPALFMNIL